MKITKNDGLRNLPWTSAVLIAAACSSALAQTQKKEDQEVEALGTSVVTGQKIERQYKRTLTSTSIVDDYNIMRSNATDINDAFRYSANVADADFIDSGIVIRGINSEGIGGPSGAPMSTLYVDGVAQTSGGARRGALGLWDVKKVEIFRGPQSTISGRNSLAGSLRVETKDPTFFWEGSSKVSVGNNGFYESALMLSGPLNDDWAFRLAGSIQHRDGDINYPNYANFKRLKERQDDDSHNFRAKLLYQPDGEDGVSALFSFSHSYDSPMYRDTDGISAGNNLYDNVWGQQSSPLFVEARSADVTQGSMKLSIPINPDLRLETITGIVRTDTDRSSVDLSSRGSIVETEVSQELRAIYQTDTVEAVSGFYYLNSKDDNLRLQDRGPTVNRQSFSDAEVNNYALFLDGRWQFQPTWWLVGGVRYDYEDQKFNSRSQSVDAGIVSNYRTNSSSASFDALLPKIGIMKDITDSSTLGFTAQKAYRAGGSAIDSVNNSAYSYDPETAYNYEISYKGQTYDNKLTYGVNVFYLDWEDQQINVPRIPNDFTSDIILNAGKSKVFGGEIELQARPVDGLTLFSSIGLSKTEFEDFAFLQFGNNVDLSGKQFPQSPEFNAVVGFTYEAQNGFFFGMDAKYTDNAVSRSLLEGLGEDKLPSYTIVNAHVGYKTGDWTVTAFADNLLNKDYLTYRYDDPAFQVGTVGTSRGYGVGLQYDF